MLKNTKLIFIMALLSYSVFTQTNDEQFNSFFQQFKSAVKDNNAAEIAGLTNFPFIWEWGSGQTNKHLSKEEFIVEPYLPDYKILAKAKFNETVTLSKDKYEEEGVSFSYSEGYYIIAWGLYNTDENYGSYSEYYFGIIHNEYNYIKCISGD
jgi:hypothetical protein